MGIYLSLYEAAIKNVSAKNPAINKIVRPFFLHCRGAASCGKSSSGLPCPCRDKAGSYLYLKPFFANVGISAQAVGCALKHDAAVTHHQSPVRNCHGDGEFLLNQ